MFTFFAFYLVLQILTFYAGKGLYITSLLATGNKERVSFSLFGVSQSTFYPILFIIFIGNISFLINFFFPLNLLLLVVPLIFFGVLGVFLDRTINIKPNEFLIYCISFITFFGIQPGEDFFLYHSNVISLLKNEKIIFGLAIFNKRYGYSSIYEYFSNYFLIDGNILLLHIPFLLFVNFFFIFIYRTLKHKSNQIKYLGVVLAIIGILDNFGFSGGKNSFIDIDNIGKFDSVFSIVFIVSFTLLITQYEKKLSTQEIFLISILILFGIQLKHTGVLLLFAMFIVSPKLVKHFMKNKIIILLGIFWILKNLLLSSCAMFPVQITCIDNFFWSVENYAKEEEMLIKDALNAFSVNLGLKNSFLQWKVGNLSNFHIFLNTSITFLIVILLEFFLLKPKIKSQLHLFKGFLIFSVFLAYIFLSIPESRFALGILTSLTILNFYFFKFKDIKVKKGVVSLIFIISLMLYPRASSYELMLSGQFNNRIDYPEIEYKPRQSSYGFTSSNGAEACWDNYFCTTPDSLNVKLDNYYKYKMFVPIK